MIFTGSEHSILVCSCGGELGILYICPNLTSRGKN